MGCLKLHGKMFITMDLDVIMQNVKKIRTLNNLTMRYMADVVGCDQGAYSRWESGQAEPKVSQLLKIAEVFKMSLDEVATYDPENPMKPKTYEAVNTIPLAVHDKEVHYMTKHIDSLELTIKTQQEVIELLKRKDP